MIDPALCQPGGTNASGVTCTYQCQVDCGRGGYPKIGVGSDLYDTPKAWKCTLCWGRAGSDADLDPAYGFGLPTKVYPNGAGEYISSISGTSVPELKHQPSCVFTCPAKAMVWDTKDNIVSYINNSANGFISVQGDGSMYWASRKSLLLAPKADPFVEDHVTPLISNMLSSPFAKAALVPAAMGAGLLALIARRQRVAEESTLSDHRCVAGHGGGCFRAEHCDGQLLRPRWLRHEHRGLCRLPPRSHGVQPDHLGGQEQ
jgi:hypothetical protein